MARLARVGVPTVVPTVMVVAVRRVPARTSSYLTSISGRSKRFPEGESGDAFVDVGVGISTLHGRDMGCVTLCCNGCNRRLACVRGD